MNTFRNFTCRETHFLHIKPWQNMHLNQITRIMHFIYLQPIRTSGQKHTCHTWQVKLVRLIDLLFVSTVFSHTVLKKVTNLKLVQSFISSLCINSFRRRERTGKGVGFVTQTATVKRVQTQIWWVVPQHTLVFTAKWIQKQN